MEDEDVFHVINYVNGKGWLVDIGTVGNLLLYV